MTKLEHSNKKDDRLAMVLFALSVILVVVVLLKAGQLFVTTAAAQRLTSGTTAGQSDDPNEIEEYMAPDKELAKQLKEKNLFAPPGPKQHPIKQVQGIMGKEALIDGKWYKAGDKVQDAEIVAIEPTLIRVKWEGKEKSFAPIAAASSKNDVKKVAEPKEKEEKAASAAEPKEEQVAPEPEEEDPLAWMGVKLSAALKAKILEKWNQMSDEEKKQMKEQWNQLSDEQKQQTIDQMEQNIDQL